ncbi:MAG TPA: IS256 family transposase [Candidatus Atribacteria bacterium]|nr:IS256 family transposase [Candidatus Atribacteria bacterium]
MTQLNNKSIQAILQEELDRDGDFLKEVVRRIMQQLMEEERDQQVGVLSHQRDNNKRKANRNGYKPRSFNTRVGKLLLAKPQIREFSFQTQLFANYQRSEKAQLSTICQMVTDGVSTNRVKKIVGKLSPDLIYSKSTVSRITQELEPQIKCWQEEKLKDYYTYLFTDAVYFYVRENYQVVSSPLLITLGVDKNGHRKILGVDLALEESYQSYKKHFEKLKERGLKQVDLTISDDHKGLIKAQQEAFPHTPHQRCIGHFVRNVLSYVPYKEKRKLADYLKQIFNSPSSKMAQDIAQLIAQEYQTSYPKVSRMLEEELEFTLTYLDYPQHHWRKIRTTNLIEGVLNKDLKQRSKVIGIFPNSQSCLRYVCLRLMEIDEEWQTGRRYMKIIKEDQDSQEDDPLLCEIKQIKEGVKTKEELVAI